MTHTVSISATRFEQSPYYENYANANTVLGVAAGRYFASSIGEDVLATYWALRRQAVMFDVPEKPWHIEGPDVLPFLERIFARRVSDLPAGRGRYAIACTAAGGTYMDGILFRLGESRFCYVQADGALHEWLVAHSAGFDVRISDPHSRVLQIQGPNSMQIMGAASQGAIDDQMRYFHSGYFDLGGQQLYVSRTGWTGELGYEIYADGAGTDHDRLWHHLLDAGAQHGMVFGSLAAMGIRRIEAGILDNISDFDISMTPYQAGLGRFIDLEKEGFTGREALLEADRKPLLLGVKCPSAAIEDAAELRSGNERVGRVTAGVWSPTLDCGIGYVRFDHADAWAGKSLLVETQSGEYAACEIVNLPFFDHQKHIPRGLRSPPP